MPDIDDRAGFLTAWDGARFQILQEQEDPEARPVWDQHATRAALAAYLADNPPPGRPA